MKLQKSSKLTSVETIWKLRLCVWSYFAHVINLQQVELYLDLCPCIVCNISVPIASIITDCTTIWLEFHLIYQLQLKNLYSRAHW